MKKRWTERKKSNALIVAIKNMQNYQRGETTMKKLWVFIGIFSILFLTLSDNAFSKGSENKAACVSWCNANRPKCVKCYSNTSCGGREYDVIQSFKKGTGNWYACGLSEYGNESQKNKTDCEAWCRQDERCEKCKTTAGCGTGYASIKKFGGRGENWYACANRDRLSQLRKQECLTWCHEHKNDMGNPCLKCSTSVGCGSGYTAIKRFQGEGENWYACTFLDSRAECENWCNNHKPECEFCSGSPGCGAGYTSMKTFYAGIFGPFEIDNHYYTESQSGKNSYACKKK